MAGSKRSTPAPPLSFIAGEFGPTTVYLATAGSDIRRALRIHADVLLKNRKDLLARMAAQDIEAVRAFVRRAASLRQQYGATFAE